MPRLILCLLLMLASLLPAEEPRLELMDIDGHAHAPLEAGDKPAILLLFIDPCSYHTILAIDTIVPNFEARVSIYLVYSDRKARPEAARDLAKSLKTKVPVLLDTQLALARKVHARVTPEAVVIGHDGKVLYKGRIDDSMREREKYSWQQPTTHDLRDALNAILTGLPVPEPQHDAVGREIPGVVPPRPADFGMNAILAIGPVLAIAGLLIPFINGYKEGSQAASVCWGWLLLFVSSLFVYWFGPGLVAKYYGPEIAEPLYSESPGPGGFLITGWFPGLLLHFFGLISRVIFDSLKMLFWKKSST